VGAAVEEESAPGAPEWLVTFSDLVSLLVTLFIMMLTFTTRETDDLVRVLDVLKGSFGFHDNKDKPELEKQLHESNRVKQGVSSPDLVKPEDRVTTVYELQNDYLTVEDFERGVRIIVDVPNGFAAGGDLPSRELAEVVRRHSLKLRANPVRRYTVIGHCDPGSDADSHVGGADLLGLSRARRVARIMGLSGVQLDHVRITSRGAHAPREAGHTAVEQDRNRRVEILVEMPEGRRTGGGGR